MIPAYCINLDRRSDRWEHMSSQFKNLNLVVERVSATDGKDPEIKARFASHPASSRLSIGALATFESHRRVWQKLIESGASHAMIFEDDLVIAPGLAEYQKTEWIPEAADLIKLETHGTRIHVGRKPFCTIGPGRTLVPLRSYHSAAGGYILSARLAERLLPMSRDCLEPVDDFIFNRHGRQDYAIYQMVPAPVVQGASGLAQVDKGNWVQSSLTEHWADGLKDSSDQAETQFGRVLRRFTEELRSIRLATRYATVPWG